MEELGRGCMKRPKLLKGLPQLVRPNHSWALPTALKDDLPQFHVIRFVCLQMNTVRLKDPESHDQKASVERLAAESPQQYEEKRLYVPLLSSRVYTNTTLVNSQTPVHRPTHTCAYASICAFILIHTRTHTHTHTHTRTRTSILSNSCWGLCLTLPPWQSAVFARSHSEILAMGIAPLNGFSQMAGHDTVGQQAGHSLIR